MYVSQSSSLFSTNRSSSSNQPVPYTCATRARIKRKEYALIARRYRVPYVHVLILSLSGPRCGPSRQCTRPQRLRCDERRICFRTRRRPVRCPLVICGRRPLNRRRGVLARVLMPVRVRLRWREPRLWTRLEHVTGYPGKLIAVCR